MKKSLFILCMLWSALAYSQISIQATVKGYGNKIIIGYYKDFAYISDTLRLNKDRAVFKFDSSDRPVYFKLQTIDPGSSTPFLIGFPGDTIAIEKDLQHLLITGGAESYNMFLTQIGAELREKFGGMPQDYNKSTRYLLDRSEAFFPTFEHPQKQMIKDMNALHIVVNFEVYPVMVTYNTDTSRMNSLFNLIKKRKAPQTSENEVIKYVDKVDFDNPNIWLCPYH